MSPTAAEVVAEKCIPDCDIHFLVGESFDIHGTLSFLRTVVQEQRAVNTDLFRACVKTGTVAVGGIAAAVQIELDLLHIQNGVSSGVHTAAIDRRTLLNDAVQQMQFRAVSRHRDRTAVVCSEITARQREAVNGHSNTVTCDGEHTVCGGCLIQSLVAAHTRFLHRDLNDFARIVSDLERRIDIQRGIQRDHIGICAENTGIKGDHAAQCRICRCIKNGFTQTDLTVIVIDHIFSGGHDKTLCFLQNIGCPGCIILSSRAAVIAQQVFGNGNSFRGQSGYFGTVHSVPYIVQLIIQRCSDVVHIREVFCRSCICCEQTGDTDPFPHGFVCREQGVQCRGIIHSTQRGMLDPVHCPVMKVGKEDLFNRRFAVQICQLGIGRAEISVGINGCGSFRVVKLHCTAGGAVKRIFHIKGVDCFDLDIHAVAQNNAVEDLNFRTVTVMIICHIVSAQEQTVGGSVVDNGGVENVQFAEIHTDDIAVTGIAVNERIVDGQTDK